MKTLKVLLTLALTVASAQAYAQTLSGTWEFGYQNAGTDQSSGTSATGFTVATARG